MSAADWTESAVMPHGVFAFPWIVMQPDGRPGLVCQGMTLREHFAGLAMQGLLAAGTPLHGAGEALRDRAYALADLMVKGPQS